MMTKKEYQAAAKIVHAHGTVPYTTREHQILEDAFVVFFKQAGGRFDEKRFRDACRHVRRTSVTSDCPPRDPVAKVLDTEIQIHDAQAWEDERARRLGVKPRLIATVEDIPLRRFRVTRPEMYGSRTPGFRDLSARQGYYVDARDEHHAREIARRVYGSEGSRIHRTLYPISATEQLDVQAWD